MRSGPVNVGCQVGTERAPGGVLQLIHDRLVGRDREGRLIGRWSAQETIETMRIVAYLIRQPKTIKAAHHSSSGMIGVSVEHFAITRSNRIRIDFGKSTLWVGGDNWWLLRQALGDTVGKEFFTRYFLPQLRFDENRRLVA